MIVQLGSDFEAKLSKIFISIVQTQKKYIFIGSVALLVSVKCLSIWVLRRNYFSQLNVPSAGFELLKLLRSSKSESENFDELVKKHGKVVGYFDGLEPVVLTTDPQIIPAILNDELCRFSTNMKLLDKLSDDEHRRMHSLLVRCFSAETLKQLTDNIILCSHNLNSQLNEKAGIDDVIEENNLFEDFSINVLCMCLFGIDMYSKASEYIEQSKLLKIILKNKKDGSCRNDALFRLFKNTFGPVIKDQRKKRNRKCLVLVLDELTDEKSHSHENENDSSLELFLLLVNGWHPVSQMLCRLAETLAKNPKCQKKLCDEIDKILLKNNGKIHFESLSKLTYLDMIIKETFRVSNLYSRVERTLSKDYTFGKMKLPKGRRVIIPFQFLNLDPSSYSKPNKFMPERYKTDKKTPMCNFHGCIGKSLAIVQLKISLVIILSKHQFTFEDQETGVRSNSLKCQERIVYRI